MARIALTSITLNTYQVLLNSLVLNFDSCRMRNIYANLAKSRIYYFLSSILQNLDKAETQTKIIDSQRIQMTNFQLSKRHQEKATCFELANSLKIEMSICKKKIYILCSSQRSSIYERSAMSGSQGLLSSLKQQSSLLCMQ